MELVGCDCGACPEEPEEGCGWSYDHTLRLIGEKDGIQSFECEECGVEVVVDPNAEAPF